MPDEIRTPQPRHALDRWPERLARPRRPQRRHPRQAPVPAVRGGPRAALAPGMTGVWGVYGPGRRWGRSARRAWIVLRAGEHEVVEFDGPLLELMTEGRTRFDQRLAALGPDVLAREFDFRGGSCATAARRRPDAGARRRAARPAQRRRDREHLEGRGVLGGRRRPVAAGRLLSMTARWWRSSRRVRPRMMRSATTGPSRDQAAGLRPRRPAVPAVRGADHKRAGRATRTGRHTGARDVRRDGSRGRPFGCAASGTRAPT